MTNQETSICQIRFVSERNYVDELFRRVPVLANPHFRRDIIQTMKTRRSLVSFIDPKTYPSVCIEFDNESTYELTKDVLCSVDAAR